MNSISCQPTLPQEKESPCLRVEIARFQARTSPPTLVARIAGCTLCRRAVAVALPALGSAPCPYLAHPSTRSRSLPLILDGGTA